MKLNQLIKLLAVVTVSALASTASALDITGPSNPSPIPPNGNPAPSCWGDNQGNDDTLIGTAGCFPSFTGSLLYKDNIGGVEEGILAGSYSTNQGDEDLTISWGGPLAADCDTLICLLVVKDGAQQFGRYVYDLSALNWNGTEAINLIDFWVGNGAISHVAIYGTDICRTDCDTTEVPEPGTLALFGAGLAGLALIRRRRRI